MAKVLNVRISDDLDDKISRISKELRLKRSDVVRLAIESFAGEVWHEDRSSAFEKIRHLIGSVSSGIPDLGTEHRKHLLRKIRKDA